MNKKTESFKENYEALKRIADELQKQEVPDIDVLVPKVEQALQAYKVCKERIDAVRTQLEEALREQAPTESKSRTQGGEPDFIEEEVDESPF